MPEVIEIRQIAELCGQQTSGIGIPLQIEVAKVGEFGESVRDGAFEEVLGQVEELEGPVGGDVGGGEGGVDGVVEEGEGSEGGDAAEEARERAGEEGVREVDGGDVGAAGADEAVSLSSHSPVHSSSLLPLRPILPCLAASKTDEFGQQHGGGARVSQLWVSAGVNWGNGVADTGAALADGAKLGFRRGGKDRGEVKATWSSQNPAPLLSPILRLPLSLHLLLKALSDSSTKELQHKQEKEKRDGLNSGNGVADLQVNPLLQLPPWPTAPNTTKLVCRRGGIERGEVIEAAALSSQNAAPLLPPFSFLRVG